MGNCGLPPLSEIYGQWEEENKKHRDFIEKVEQKKKEISRLEDDIRWAKEYPGPEKYDFASARTREKALRAEQTKLEEQRDRQKTIVEKAYRKRRDREDSGVNHPRDFFDWEDPKQTRQWLVEGVLVEGEVCLLAGPRKTLKTSIALDLAVSLSSGQPFLGRFPVSKKGRVLFLSGESGQPTIVETARRIASAKGISDVADLDIWWGTELPSVDRPDEGSPLEVAIKYRLLTDVIEEVSPSVVIIDPLYVMLFSKMRGNAGSLFDVGPMLSALVEACKPATPVLVHHATKDLRAGQMMVLGDEAFAGCQEFARQWFLINRRRPFVLDQEADVHKLLVSYGGSAGHNGNFALDIDEGKLMADFTGRTWNLEIMTPEEAKARDEKVKKEKAAVRKADRRKGYLDKLLAALPADGRPISYTAARSASGLNSDSLKAALAIAGDRIEIVVNEKARTRTLSLTTARTVAA
jgi:hypothetical protein